MENIKDILVKLGWSHYDENLWTKGQLGVVELENAILWELEYWKAIQGTMFICPDCGYKVQYRELEQSLRY